MVLMEKIQDKSYAIQPAFGFSNVNTGLGANFQQILQQLFTVPEDLNLPPMSPSPTPFAGPGIVIPFGNLTVTTAPPPSFQSSQNPLAPLTPPPNVSASDTASTTEASQPSSPSNYELSPFPPHTEFAATPIIVQTVHFVFNPETSSWELVQNPLGNQNAPGPLSE